MSVTLYGWGAMFDVPSPSPYVMKSDMQLQMLDIDFDRAIADLDSVPKRKAPYVKDDDTLIEDSNFIRQHFEQKLDKRIDAHLSRSDMVTSWALERMAEDHLNTVMAMERWLKPANFAKGPALFFMGLPEGEREAVTAGITKTMEDGLIASGFGRHSEDERLQLAAMDLGAIAMQLGDKPFLFGDMPSAADASVGAQVISAATEYFDTPLSGLVRRFDNLVPYAKRLEETYFAADAWPSMM